jgi:prephenate dehydrogenase
MFNKVAIVGTGLIGGSMALAIKKKRLANKVIGVSRHKKTLLFAKNNGVIDIGSQDIKVIKDADLLILATPVSTVLTLAPRISRIIKPDCIVTDVGSTKKQIVSKLETLFSRYIGSHPLAGSEKRGINNADADIFKGSLCILTPTKKTNKIALGKIKNLWNILGAKVFFLTPDTHDKILSFISHLPHVVAFSLIGIVPKKYLRFASSGIKDMTRIAASDSELWSDIFLSNPRNIANAIDLLQKTLSKIKSTINKRDKKLLALIIKEAKKRREAL